MPFAETRSGTNVYQIEYRPYAKALCLHHTHKCNVVIVDIITTRTVKTCWLVTPSRIVPNRTAPKTGIGMRFSNVVLFVFVCVANDLAFGTLAYVQ